MAMQAVLVRVLLWVLVSVLKVLCLFCNALWVLLRAGQGPVVCYRASVFWGAQGLAAVCGSFRLATVRVLFGVFVRVIAACGGWWLGYCHDAA